MFLLKFRYLYSNISTPTKNFQFFDSVFHNQLELAIQENSSHVDKSKRAYDAVRKWNRGGSVFEKDYLLIPINQR